MHISYCLEVTEPCRPPDGFIVEPLYGCRRSVGGASFLARSVEVVCWRVRHLDAHRTWEPRCRHVTRRMFPSRWVRWRQHRSLVCIFHLFATWWVWCRRHRSVAVVLSVVPPSGDSYAMKKGVAVLPRYPDVLGA